MPRQFPGATAIPRTGGKPLVVVDKPTGTILPLNVSVPSGTNKWMKLSAIHPYDSNTAVVTILYSNNNVVTTWTHRYSIIDNITAYPGMRVILTP